MIYLDNAATTLVKPKSVERAVLCAMQTCANPGRGWHPAALRAAKRNAIKNGVENRLTLIKSDALCEILEGAFFAILSNPPYVTEKSYGELAPEIYFEPKIAFVGGGEDGASFYERITELYHTSLTEDGFIAFEIGYDQRGPIENIAKRYGMSCEIRRDLGGNDRLAILKNTK